MFDIQKRCVPLVKRRRKKEATPQGFEPWLPKELHGYVCRELYSGSSATY